jgi:uncharacterized protein YbjQ (UPF0145 family)
MILDIAAWTGASMSAGGCQERRDPRGDEPMPTTTSPSIDINAPLALPVSTTQDIPGAPNATYVGPVFGVIARSMGFAKGFTGSFKAFRQGEVTEFTGTLEEARRAAVERMVEHAQQLGAQAVVGMRFDSTDMGEQQGLAEIVAYGTAVRY